MIYSQHVRVIFVSGILICFVCVLGNIFSVTSVQLLNILVYFFLYINFQVIFVSISCIIPVYNLCVHILSM